MSVVIGVISDTRGLVRSGAMEALRGCVAILHAGEIGSAEVLASLRQIAPVYAVRGPSDQNSENQLLPEKDLLVIADRHIYLMHDPDALDVNPAEAGIDIVVSGTSSKPKIEQRDGVLYCSPGSVGPRRYPLPITLAKIHLGTEAIHVESVEIAA